MPNWAIIRRSLMTDFVRNFLCFDDFWPNAASAKSSHKEFADGLFLVISIMEGVMHTKKTGSDLQLIANLIRFFNLRQSSSTASLHANRFR